MSKWVCSECKHSNNSHTRYCLKCGHFKEGNIVKKAIVTWRCPICKAENNDNSKYCWKCGHWLLSEKYTPTKIKKVEQDNYSKQTKINNTHENKMSKTSIIELFLIIILGFSILIGEGSLRQALPYILVWTFMIHLVFSVVYIVKAFLRNGFVDGGKTLLIHVALLLLLFIGVGFSNNQSVSYTNVQADTLNTIKSSAVELEYEDLLRNADGNYENMYVEVSGRVYHLENGNQNNVMINISSDPFQRQTDF